MSTIQPTDEVIYRERLTPPVWIFVIILLGAPMLAIAFKPLGDAFSLIVAGVAAIAIVLFLSLSAPEIKVTKKSFSAGRARIERSYISNVSPLVEESEIEKRQLHGKATTWLLLRAGIKTAVRISIDDPDDPYRTWVVSSRTPDRIVAALHSNNG